VLLGEGRRWRVGALTAVVEPCVRFGDLNFSLLLGWVTCGTHYGRLTMDAPKLFLGDPLVSHAQTLGILFKNQADP